jgi:glutamate-1-semialdehyde aminotransferase
MKGKKRMKNASKSDRYFKYEYQCLDEGLRSIAHGALTNSKRLSSFVAGVYPAYAVKGENEKFITYEGEEYIDYLGALGTNFFGYANPTINVQITKAISDGVLFSLGSHSEVEFARLFKQKFSYVDKVRVLKSGTEGCMAAVRMARTYTRREKVLSEGYHGWSDEFVSLTPPGNGVPKKTSYQMRNFDWGLLSKDVAAVIIEPVVLDYGANRREFVHRLREACNQHGIVLIFDETITGLRFKNLSVANYWGIEPDLTIMGKALANGLPISCVAGKDGVMESDYFVSSTFAGDRVALEAAICCLKLVGGEFDPSHLWGHGQKFIDELNEVLNPSIEVLGYPTRGAFVGNETIKNLFFQEMVKLNWFFHPMTWFYNKYLPSHLEHMISNAKIVMRRILSGDVKLEGIPYQKPFSKGDYDD